MALFFREVNVSTKSIPSSIFVAKTLINCYSLVDQLTWVVIKRNVVFGWGSHSFGVSRAGLVRCCHGSTGWNQGVVGVA